jgi:hypothetical protein
MNNDDCADDDADYSLDNDLDEDSQGSYVKEAPKKSVRGKKSARNVTEKTKWQNNQRQKRNAQEKRVCQQQL